MLRRHFITGEDKPDIIITYHSSKHVPFFGGKETRNLLMTADYENVNIDENIEDFKSPISFNIVLDTWNDGVGQWGIKFNNSEVFNYYSMITISNNEYVAGYAEGYMDFNNNVFIDNIGHIESIIFDENIIHINESILMPGTNNKSVLKEVTLPNSLKYLTGGAIFIGHRNLKSLIIPENVIRIDNLVSIYRINDLDNVALEEITLLPFNPPLFNGRHGPLGSKNIGGELINPNFKIKVYADCIDKYKNDAVWGQYSELYDIINNTIIYYTEDGSRKIYKEQNNITSIPNIYDIKLEAVKIYFPNTITNFRISDYYKLEELIIPDGVTKLTSYCIGYCNALKKLTINNNIVESEYGSISSCDNLHTIIFNNNNITLYDTVSLDVRSTIETIIIGDDVKYLRDYTFSGFPKLNNITIPENVIEIGKSVFYESKIDENENYIKGPFLIIDNYAWVVSSDTDSTLEIEEGIKAIAINVYSPQIKTIKIPSTLNGIRSDTFSDCPYLNNIIIDSNNPNYNLINYSNGITIVEKNLNKLIIYIQKFSDDYNCPNNIKIIGKQAFKYHTKLTIGVTIPISVEKIEEEAFNLKISNLIYLGTIEQWNSIIKDNNWNNSSATVVHCTDGDVEI